MTRSPTDRSPTRRTAGHFFRSTPARTMATAVGFLAASLLLAAVLTTVLINVDLLPENTRGAFSIFCHGIPARCLLLGTVPMPICTRCGGIVLGIAAASLSFLLFSVTPRRRPSAVLWLLALSPLVIDGSTQALGLRESSNLLRALTGLLAGYGCLGWAILRVAYDTRASVFEGSANPPASPHS